MAETAQLAQVSVEGLEQGTRAVLAQVSIEVMESPTLTLLAQVSAEALTGGTRTRLAQLSVEVLWRSVPLPPLPRFPAALAYGAQGGPGFSTDVVLTADGQESRNVNWAEARCRWDVGSIHRSKAEIEILIAFFHAVAQGQEGLFVFRDFTDDAFNSPIGVGDGSTAAFPLVKVYATGPYSRARRLTHPVEGSVSVALDGVFVGGWTLDYGTGLLTFATPPGAGVVVSAAGNFEVLCRFAQDHLPVTVVTPGVYSCGQMDIVEVRT
jgi:uncharacterized protein (TIGR02217 family)